MAEYVFCDFEFNEQEVILGCFLDSDGNETSLDFRDGKSRPQLQRYVTDHCEHVWVAYAAKAEMESLLRLGVDITPLQWIDLMAEATMITGTHRKMWVPSPSLLNHLKVFGVSSEADTGLKTRTRDLILSGRTFSREEWREIVGYCWTDVRPLPDLLQAIREFHSRIGTEWDEEIAANRGEYLIASAILEHRSRGLPVDADWIDLIFENKTAIANGLAQACNEHYGVRFYWYDHSTKTHSFSNAGLEVYLDRLPYPVEWDRTATGTRRRLDNDYLDELVKKYEELKEFKRTRNTLNQLNSGDLRALVQPGGFIRPVSLPFYTVTGRNQPLPSKGFLLNLPPWLRSVIRPHEGWVLVAADWSKQEIAIAAALSEDQALLDAYNTGDIYLALARMAGAVPKDGTAETHPLQRQAYKSVQLGLGYGMGVEALARSLFYDLNQGKDCPVISLEEAKLQAREIYDWHKRTFQDYWAYLNSEARAARSARYTTSKDGWFYFADQRTPFTRLMNFPMQSNGAVMLREAVKTLAFETDLDIPCTLHDAIYVNCREDDVDDVVTILKEIMGRAVEAVIGTAVTIDVGINVYTHDKGYTDKRGEETLNRVLGLLEEALLAKAA